LWRPTPAGAIPLEHTTAGQREVVDLTGKQDAAMLAGEDLSAAAPATDASSAGAECPRRRALYFVDRDKQQLTKSLLRRLRDLGVVVEVKVA